MSPFPIPVFGLLVAFLLVAGRSWGQSVPEPLAQVLRQYQPLAKTGTSVAVGPGTVQLPPQATLGRTGGTDSYTGELHLKGLLIYYDIGKMAGVHVSAYNRGGNGGKSVPFSAYEERKVDSLQLTLGLRPSPKGSEVVATLQDPSRLLRDSASLFPANFWAVVHTEAELQQFLSVVFSYRPTTRP
jgi:hypothetical protein